MEDIEQKIVLNYQTNAETTAQEVGVLSDSVDSVTDSQNKNTEATKKNEQSLTSFKTQLRQANQELLKVSQTYGETSKEAVQAAKKVADLKDQMSFAKDLVDKFNPDQKMKALTAATSLAATAMTGVVSGMALFGDQSEDTEKMLLKVQSAMAFSSAISGLSDVVDQFKVLKTTLVSAYAIITEAKTADTIATEANVVAENQSFLAKAKQVVVNGALSVTTGIVTAAQWAWNTAMAANPIGAIVAVVIALVAAGYALVKMFQASSAESERATQVNNRLNASIDNLNKSFSKSSEQMELYQKRTLGLAKANGASSESIRKLTLSLVNQEIAEKRLNAEKAYSIFLEAKRMAMSEDATEAQIKTFEEAKKFYISQNDALKGSLKKRKEIVIENEIEVAQEKTDAKNKEIEANKKHNEELAKQAEEKKKKDIEAAKKRNEELEKLRKEAREKELKENEESWNKYLELGTAKTKQDIDNRVAFDELDKENTDFINNQKLEKLKERTQKELEIEQAVADGKKSIQDASFGVADKGIELAKSLGIKSKAIQKGLLIAESASGIAKIVVSTQAANAADTAAAALMGPAGVPYLATKKVLNTTSAAIGAAANIAATAKALSALGGGGAPSSGNIGSSNGGGGETSQTPQVSFQNSQENQIATSLGGKLNEQPPIKTYITTGDVATGLLLHNKIIEENQI